MAKLYKKLMCAGVLCGMAMPALAVDPAVLVVDFDQVLASSAAAQSGTSQLRAKFDPQTASLRTAYATAVQAYNVQANAAKQAKPGTPPSPALQQAAQRVEQTQQQVQAFNQQVSQATSYVRTQIIDHARPIAEQIRAQRKALVVIPKGEVVTSDPSADITGAVIQQLNRSFLQPSITPPQQPAATRPAQ
jgi:Skp family chaperone for outer membrane proteins